MHARRAALLVDAEQYFAALEETIAKAKRSIAIAGWDFDGSIHLTRGESAPTLAQLLRETVEARPELDVRILVWSVAVVHAPGHSVPLLFGADWEEHPRIQLRLDTRHPFYGAQHQKLVCIDDCLAFAGGIDLTVERWDTRDHAAEDERRSTPDGERYAPVHDMQLMFDGEAARAISGILRERWQQVVGEEVAPEEEGGDLWPPDTEPDFSDVTLGIARTSPGGGGEPPIREIAGLTTDMILSARRSIYIEAQYLAGRDVRDALEVVLSRENAPEVVVVTTRLLPGLLERFAMGANRDRMIRRLNRVDRANKLRVLHPVVPGREGECDILVHAKLVIVDDNLLRVGSSNLNNRSHGLDTECDIVIEAQNVATREAISNIRTGLLAEHLGVEVDEVRSRAAEHGSLIGAIDELNRGERGLRQFSARGTDGPTSLFPGTRLMDPIRPFDPLWFLRKKR